MHKTKMNPNLNISCRIKKKKEETNISTMKIR